MCNVVVRACFVGAHDGAEQRRERVARRPSPPPPSPPFSTLSYTIISCVLNSCQSPSAAPRHTRPCSARSRSQSCTSAASTFAPATSAAMADAPDRDDPSVILERFARVGVASALAPCLVLAAAALPGGNDINGLCAAQPASLLRWFGLQPLDVPTLLLATAAPLVLTMILFIGPLFEAWQDGELSHLSAMGDGKLQTIRNLLVGPLTEEWVFRAHVPAAPRRRLLGRRVRLDVGRHLWPRARPPRL